MKQALENKKSYVVCSSPRSGSTYLTLLLESTGLLGKPYEWLRGDGGRPHPDYTDYPTGPQDQLEQLLRDGGTPNGVVALKMFPEHFDKRTESLWAERLPSLQYVRLVRQDLLGQAISLSMARQTDSYAYWTPERREPVYNREHIRNCMEFITTGDARWRLFFAKNNISPLFITYEDFTPAPQEVVNRVAALVGVDNAPIDWSLLNIRVQRDERNAQWRERYVEDEGDLAILPQLVGVPFEDTLWRPRH
jgi:LPS sulfotransferase NodH